MDVTVLHEELRVDGIAVRGRRDVAAVLGPADRTGSGTQDLVGVTVDVWDVHGIMAGDAWVAFAVGPNVLEEPIWPTSRHRGRITIDGDELVHVALGVDPLREDRRVGEVGNRAITLVVSWDGIPAKLVVRPAPGA